jgi:signal transduction histidine kinase
MSARATLAPEPATVRVLQVANNEADAQLIAQALRNGGLLISGVIVRSEAEFITTLQSHHPDVVIADCSAPAWDGLDPIETLRCAGVDAPLIVVSGAVGEVAAVEFIKRGAADYVLKNGLARLPQVVCRALEEKRTLRLYRQAQADLSWRVEELARSNADLEQFAHVASHDLQEPLRMVASYTQLLGERYRGKLDADADKFIDYACDGAARMKTLIQDLMAFSRIGRDDDNSDAVTNTARKSVDSYAALDEALLNLGPAIGESGAVIARAPLPAVLADRWQLARVFQNLIANAIKFHGTNPPAISIEARKSGEQCLFSVSDNGIGVAPEDAENIFVVFHRLHTRAEYAGSGIGLAICKKIVEHYGGKIWVESQAGCGSVFKFTLPCDEATNETQIAGPADSGVSRSG